MMIKSERAVNGNYINIWEEAEGKATKEIYVILCEYQNNGVVRSEVFDLIEQTFENFKIYTIDCLRKEIEKALNNNSIEYVAVIGRNMEDN